MSYQPSAKLYADGRFKMSMSIFHGGGFKLRHARCFPRIATEIHPRLMPDEYSGDCRPKMLRFCEIAAMDGGLNAQDADVMAGMATSQAPSSHAPPQSARPPVPPPEKGG